MVAYTGYSCGSWAVLRQLRKEKGLSQDALGKLVDTKVTSISRWEVNKVLPNLEMAVKLADALGVSLDVLCGKKVNEVSKLEKLALKASKLPENDVKALEIVLERFLQ